MFSDVHYADRDPVGTRFYRQSLAKVREAVDHMNRELPDFVIELGDFKDQDLVPNEENTLKYLSSIEAEFRKFKGPTYHVLGNHDNDGISKTQFLERVQNTGISSTKSYYSFNLKNIHLVVLDGNFTKDGTAYDHGNFTWEDAMIPEIQIKWLQADLQQNSLPVIVFIHQLLDDSTSAKHSVRNAADVRAVLEQSGKVLCVFQGHVHQEKYAFIHGIHYYSVNAVVDKEGSENNPFMLVNLYQDGRLKIDGFHNASNREFRAKVSSP